jgi:hypothetical protein
VTVWPVGHKIQMTDSGSVVARSSERSRVWWLDTVLHGVTRDDDTHICSPSHMWWRAENSCEEWGTASPSHRRNSLAVFPTALSHASSNPYVLRDIQWLQCSTGIRPYCWRTITLCGLLQLQCLGISTRLRNSVCQQWIDEASVLNTNYFSRFRFPLFPDGDSSSHETWDIFTKLYHVRRWVAGLLPGRSGFDTRSVGVG